MAIKCGHCHGHHDTVGEVRTCSLSRQQVPGLPGVTYGEVTQAHNMAVPQPRNPEYGQLKKLRAQLADALVAIVPGHDKYRLAVRLPGEQGRVRFFRVDVPQRGAWMGCVFVKEQAGDDFHKVKGAAREEQVVRGLLADVRRALKLYGLELGACGICGRTLTDEDSRERGIGPICADKMAGAF